MNTASDDARALRAHIAEYGAKHLSLWDSLTDAQREMHAGLVSKMSVDWAYVAFLAYPHERS